MRITAAPHPRSVQSAMLSGIALFCFSFTPAQAALHVLKFTVPAGNNDFIYYLDDPSLNNKPTAKLNVTQRFETALNNHPIGVYYDPAKAKWSVFNEDLVMLPTGAGFNVLVGPHATVNASAANSVGHITFFSTAAGKLPFNPTPTPPQKTGYLFFSHNWEPFPALKAGLYEIHNQSVGYGFFAAPSPNAKKWYISNEDNAPSVAASYFVFDASTTPAGATRFGHTSAAGNINLTGADPDETFLDNTATNNTPAAVIFITPVGDATYNHTVGVLYNTFNNPDKWTIVNEDGTNFGAGKDFNVLVFPDKIP